METKYLTAFLAIIAAAILLIALAANSSVAQEAQAQQKAPYINITSGELKAMLQSKDFKLINVHIPYQGEIGGTDMFIPYNEIGEKISLAKDGKIVLYCRSGSMSREAAEKLAALGYSNVYNLEMGMNEWKSEGNELIENNGG